MATTQSKPRVIRAVEALQSFDRDEAVRLLAEELREGPQKGNVWKSVGKLAATIGEIDMCIEASRRYSRTEPLTLDRLLHYWGELVTYGRTREARDEISRVPASARAHESVLHFLGTLSGQEGDFEAAEATFRQAISQTSHVPQTWFALAMIKTFTPGDPDIVAMERIRPGLSNTDPAIQARFLYGLAKAHHDIGEYDRAFALYSEGAALRRRQESFDPGQLDRFADALINDFTPKNLERLTPATRAGTRAIFVNGLPRSGTTLVEQILTSHSAVSDGGEVNLMRAALIPTGDYSFAGALRYQNARGVENDPWGTVARQYNHMLDMRFASPGLIVDKTLSQSHYMGLILHALPDAKVVWLRRQPEDVALSCFRSYFTSPVPWSWSLTDIARYFRAEDRLFAHWMEVSGDRILPVSYEDLVSDPQNWIRRILGHCALKEEPAVFVPHETRREVRTASVQQVRAPISTRRIGAAEAYAGAMKPFHDIYRS